MRLAKPKPGITLHSRIERLQRRSLTKHQLRLLSFLRSGYKRARRGLFGEPLRRDRITGRESILDRLIEHPLLTVSQALAIPPGTALPAIIRTPALRPARKRAQGQEHKATQGSANRGGHREVTQRHPAERHALSRLQGRKLPANEHAGGVADLFPCHDLAGSRDEFVLLTVKVLINKEGCVSEGIEPPGGLLLAILGYSSARLWPFGQALERAG